MVIQGKLVFLTGAGSGIGRALAREFLAEGGRVVAIDRDEETLRTLKEDMALLGLKIDTVKADVGDKEKFLLALETTSSILGAPDIFVNNAGIAKVSGFASSSLDAFENILRVNLNGVIYGAHFALSKMGPEGGLIVNMASMAGHVPAGYMASYSTSKFAVVGFTRALQAELEMSQSPVKTCLVSPGFVDTPIMRQEGVRFPWYLRWMVGKPEAAAKEIVAGIKGGREEIYPDAGGRMMRLFYRLAPKWTVRSSRVLLAKSVFQAIGKTPINL